MRIKLLKTDSERDQSSLGCYISVNGNLVDVVTPLNNPHETVSIEIPNEGLLRLMIRDMGKSDGYIGSVSIPINILETSSSVWLPLCESPNNDTIFQISSETKTLPRILIGCYSNYCDDELFFSQEVKEKPPSDIIFASIISVEHEPEEPLIKTSRFSHQESLCESKKQEIIELLNEEINNFKDDIDKEKEKNKNLQAKFNQMMEMMRINSERSCCRESSLLELMNEKEENLRKSIEINIDLQSKVRKLEHEKIQLEEVVDKMKLKESYTESLEKELKKYQEFLRLAEKNREELTFTLVEYSQADCYNPALAAKVKKFSEPLKYIE